MASAVGGGEVGCPVGGGWSKEEPPPWSGGRGGQGRDARSWRGGAEVGSGSGPPGRGLHPLGGGGDGGQDVAPVGGGGPGHLDLRKLTRSHGSDEEFHFECQGCSGFKDKLY